MKYQNKSGLILHDKKTKNFIGTIYIFKTFLTKQK